MADGQDAKLRVGAQPPVPFVEPFARIAQETGVVDRMCLVTFDSLVKESGMKLSSILTKRWASYRIDSGLEYNLVLVADWDELLGDNDVVFVLSEKA